jgi:anti-sigma factor RsiW
MIKPSSWSSREEALLLVNAYLDGELDASTAVEVERRMAADAALKAEYERLLRLRTTIATRLEKDRASDALRERIAAIAGPDNVAAVPDGAAAIVIPLKRAARRYDWTQMAAAATIACFVGSGATYFAQQLNAPSGDVATIVAGHQRALLAASPVDVPSTDRHTVKPWFDAKLALSPHIIDLASIGFPLMGGRVEVIKGQAVPVLVYQRRAHLISVIALPRPGGGDDGTLTLASTRDGYVVRSWRGRDFVYYAVADLPPDELDSFVASWRRQAAAE